MGSGPGWDFDRTSRVWRVRESEHYVFHLEPVLCEDAELGAILEGADERQLRIRQALGQSVRSIKERERLLKTHYWLYSGSSLRDAAESAGYRSMACGTANPTGVHFAQLNMSWRDLLDQMTHEEIHLLWSWEVGEAPSLLNEGVAVYFEAVLSIRSAERLEALRDAWLEVSRDGSGFLRELSRNSGFWEAHARGRPVYAVGGALAGYLVKARGLPLVKGLFLDSHYEDDALAQLLEHRTGLPIEELEARVGEWWRGVGDTG